jgi:DNA adenine methylase
MRSPIKMFGGKGLCMNEIYRLFPKGYSKYIEPFCGSAIIALNRPSEPKCTVEIINDLNKNIYSLYKVLQDPVLFQQFKNRCELSIFSEDFRKESIELLKTKLSILDRAYHFFYVNRTSFNGIGGFSINISGRRGLSKSISDMLSTIDRFEELHQRLSSTIITNRDALELIQYQDSNDAFMYLDPPYVLGTRTSTRYEVDLTDDQQKDLLNIITKCKSKILLSGYDNDLYEQILCKENHWNKYQFESNLVKGDLAHTPKTTIETLWYNYTNNKFGAIHIS